MSGSHSHATPHADDVTLQFLESAYTYSEGVGNGTVCVGKAGVTNEMVQVIVHGGKGLETLVCLTSPAQPDL